MDSSYHAKVLRPGVMQSLKNRMAWSGCIKWPPAPQSQKDCPAFREFSEIFPCVPEALDYDRAAFPALNPKQTNNQYEHTPQTA
jgi:hypothetical protein